jgi:hypothetical protein
MERIFNINLDQSEQVVECDNVRASVLISHDRTRDAYYLSNGACSFVSGRKLSPARTIEAHRLQSELQAKIGETFSNDGYITFWSNAAKRTYWMKQQKIEHEINPPAHPNITRLQEPVTSEQDNAILQPGSNKKVYNYGTYIRSVAPVDVTFACDRCKRGVTVTQQPGKTPLYCKECLPEVIREQNKERARRHRANKKAVTQSC